jgi:hypothetical protein
MKNEAKVEIVKRIQRMSGSQSSYSIFSDWIECFALSIANTCMMIHGSVWQEREKRYLQIINKYNKEERMQFAEMCELLTAAYEDGDNFRFGDILGEIYMESGSGNKHTGQFFTPYHVSLLTAQMSVSADYDGEKPIKINEPACGSGGMIVAAAEVLHRRGINFQRCMRVETQDLDWKAVYMCYVQLSLLGIDAVVIQGDTLTEPYTGGNYPQNKVFRTPCNMGMLLLAAEISEMLPIVSRKRRRSYCPFSERIRYMNL